MVLTNNGPLSFSQIRTEYSITGSISLSQVRSLDRRLGVTTVRMSDVYSKYSIPQTNLTVWLDRYISGNTWVDVMANANATLVNNPTSSWREELVFNGSNQYCTLPDITDITDFDSTKNYSVCCWVNIDSSQVDLGNDDNDIVEKWSSVGSYPYVIRLIRSNLTIRGALYNGSLNPGINSLTITTNTWIFITFVVNRSVNQILLYINNSTAVTTTITSYGNSNNSLLYLMCRGSTSNHTKGRFGKLFIYNRVLLSTEVSSMFNSTRDIFSISLF
jgi:hypothetical protein